MRGWVCKILKGIAVTGFLCLEPSQVQAANVYMTVCAAPAPNGKGRTTGCWNNGLLSACTGAGTLANPWCEDPNGDGRREYAMAFFDNNSSVPDVSSGDTVNLCAAGLNTLGAPVPCGSGNLVTVKPSCIDFGTGGYKWFRPRQNFTSETTIQAYTDSSTGITDRITISGDSNNNGIPDVRGACTVGGGVCTFPSHGSAVGCASGSCVSSQAICDATGANATDISLFIDPRGTQSMTAGNITFRNLKLTQTVNGMFNWEATAMGNWKFDGVEMSEPSDTMWGGVEVGSTACSSINPDAYPIKFSGLASGATFTFINGKIHNACANAFRIIENGDHNNTVTITDNEFYNMLGVIDSYGNWVPTSNTWTVVNFKRNRIHDVYTGTSAEGRSREWYIEDNTYACEGIYKLINSSEGRKCGVAFHTEDGTGGGFFEGQNRDIYIRRNRIYAANNGPNGQGSLLVGIDLQADCRDANGCTATNTTVENNVLFDINPPFAGSSIGRGGISVSTSKAITVRNNTIYGGHIGITLDDAGAVVDHSVYNNIIFSPSEFGIITYPGSTTATTTYNNIYSPTLANVVSHCSVVAGNGDCTTDVGDYTCANVNTLNTGNKCLPSEFMNPTSPIFDQRDYRLSPYDASGTNIEAGTTGPSDDKDQDTRPMSVDTDIGADEVIVVNGSAQLNTFGSPSTVKRDAACACTRGDIVSLDSDGLPAGRTLANDYAFHATFDSCVDGLVSPCKGWFLNLTNLRLLKPDGVTAQTYTITYWIRTTLENIGSNFEVRQYGVTSSNPFCQHEPVGNSCVIDLVAMGSADNVGAMLSYQFQSVVFSPESSSTQIRFRPQLAAIYTGDVYVDDIHVKAN